MLPLIPIAMQLAQFAPGIIKLLTGSDKAEEVAGKVIDVAKAVTGTNSGSAAVAAVTASSEKAMEFQLAMADKQDDLEKAYLADVKDARDRDVKLAQAGKRNVRADIMVLLDVIGLIACLIVLCFYNDRIPGEAVGLISTVAATFGLCLRDAHQFEFGSTRSSRDKDATISNLSGKA